MKLFACVWIHKFGVLDPLFVFYRFQKYKKSHNNCVVPIVYSKLYCISSVKKKNVYFNIKKIIIIKIQLDLLKVLFVFGVCAPLSK